MPSKLLDVGEVNYNSYTLQLLKTGPKNIIRIIIAATRAWLSQTDRATVTHTIRIHYDLAKGDLRSLETEPLDISYTTYIEIFDVAYYRDLELWVKDH